MNKNIAVHMIRLIKKTDAGDSDKPLAFGKAGTFDKAAMIERFGGDEESVDLIVESFVEEAAQIISSLEQAVKIGDLEQIRLLSHSLKGSAANVHANLLNKIAFEMETAAKSGVLLNSSSILEAIKKEFQLFVEFIALEHV